MLRVSGFTASLGRSQTRVRAAGESTRRGKLDGSLEDEAEASFVSQALKQLLEAEAAPLSSEEEAEAEGRDDANGSETWDPSEPSNSALAPKDHVLARLLQDLVRSTKRSWNRHKKGGLRSCFGVRLERIGSFSGLGC